VGSRTGYPVRLFTPPETTPPTPGYGQRIVLSLRGVTDIDAWAESMSLREPEYDWTYNYPELVGVKKTGRHTIRMKVKRIGGETNAGES
jgi:hypothetical protein